MRFATIVSFLFGVVISIFALSTSALAQERPTLNVGDSRTYVLNDAYTGREIDRATNKVVAVNADGSYGIERTSAMGGVSTFKLSKNLGQGEPVDGKMGDGNLYDFPLITGKRWVTTSYKPGRKGGVIRDEMEYTVTGEEDITVPAGTFHVTKIVGSGRWYWGNYEGTVKTTSYYSALVKSTVRYERESQSGSGMDRTVMLLVSLEDAK